MTVSRAPRDLPRAAEPAAVSPRSFPPARELSLRAVLAGCAIGSVLAVGNVYMGLKTGWGDQGNITASLAGFAVFAFARRFGRADYSPLENNITQTVASSAAGMSFTAGLVSAFPALSMMGHTYPSWAIGAWAVALGAAGVLIALLLRERLIAQEKLPFPSGIATAEVIEALHRAASSALRRARALIGSGAGAMALVWLRDGKPAWVPQLAAAPLRVAGISAESLGFGLNFSPLLLGTGLLIGTRNGLSLLLGSVVAWAALAPLAVQQRWVGSVEFSVLSGWLLWPGVALMASAALSSLLLQWETFGRGLKDLIELRSARTGPRSAARYIWAAPIGLALVVTSVGWIVFGLHPLFTLLALVLSILLSSVCARATGETDIAPVTQMGQLTQLSVGLLSPSMAGNVLSGAVVSGAAAQTAQTLWSLKAGALLGANQRSVIRAQLLGIAIGALVVVPAYALVSRAYGLGSTALPAPAAASWKGLAGLLQSGFKGLPPGALAAASGALLLGALLAFLDRKAPCRLLPSAVAMGVGFLAPASYGVTIGLGAVLLGAAKAVNARWAQTYGDAIASGTIAGESLMGVLIAVLLSLGVLNPS
jgi:uncharacterized oligopeptide transporter (OPT) family protein